MKGMFWLSACPRCRGDLYLDRNEFGEGEFSCMQCGFRRFDTPMASRGLTGRSEPEPEHLVAVGVSLTNVDVENRKPSLHPANERGDIAWVTGDSYSHYAHGVN